MINAKKQTTPPPAYPRPATPYSRDNGETWSLYHDTDTEKGSVRAGHEYSYPACVPWPKDSAEEVGASRLHHSHHVYSAALVSYIILVLFLFFSFAALCGEEHKTQSFFFQPPGKASNASTNGCVE